MSSPSIIYLGKGDTAPAQAGTVKLAGAAVDLTGYEVVARVELEGGRQLEDIPCTVVDPANGRVSFEPTSELTAVAGKHKLRLVCTKNGKPFSSPNRDWDWVIVS